MNQLVYMLVVDAAVNVLAVKVDGDYMQLVKRYGVSGRSSCCWTATAPSCAGAVTAACDRCQMLSVAVPRRPPQLRAVGRRAHVAAFQAEAHGLHERVQHRRRG